MTQRTAALRTDPAIILGAVVELLASDGYDNWQLRDVADRARVSLATIYKHFPSRDELILAAVEHWMEQHSYSPMQDVILGESVFDALIRMFRTIFEPWEKHPKMLDAFVRARAADGTERLFSQGLASVEPMAAVFARLDPTDAADLGEILTNVTFGAMSRYVVGEIGVSDILPAIERTFTWLKEPHGTTSRRIRSS